jgi:hypothetical protein
MQAAQPLGMPLFQAPIAPALLLAAKLVTLGRIVARRGPVAHSGELSGSEQLKLSHRIIISHPARGVPFAMPVDHANLQQGPATSAMYSAIIDLGCHGYV